MSEANNGGCVTSPAESIDELKAAFNQQTSKIVWQELQRFYANGVVIAVAPHMDLIEVACQFSLDNKDVVAAWIQDGTVFKVKDLHAQRWYEQRSTHWAVVVDPWVLIQESVKQTEGEAGID